MKYLLLLPLVVQELVLVHADRGAPAEHENQAPALVQYMIYQAVYWNLLRKARAAQCGARQ